jgi:hypothetical protein
VILNGETDGSWFGAETALGDITGDGVADAIVATRHLPNLNAGGRVFVYDFSDPLPAQAFPCHGGHTIVVASGSRLECFRVEPEGGSYVNADVDLASLKLRSVGTGEVEEITAISSRSPKERDTDRNGISEIGVSFEREDLRSLFLSIEGRQRVDVSLEGRHRNGRRIQAPMSLTIVGSRKKPKPICRVHPNPANPQAALSFETTTAGQVTARLFDVLGRCVRTLVAGGELAAGTHVVIVDGNGDRGDPLASGVYFYRIDGPDGRLNGRLVIAR